MESDFDIKELWKKQVVPPADRAEMQKQIRRLRKNGFKKSVFLHLILLLTIVFMIFIWTYFNPNLLSTKIGIIIGILPMCIVVMFNRKMISLYKALDEKQTNKDYLNNLLVLKEKENFMHTKVMGLYVILLSVGIVLYMYEYTLGWTLAFRVMAYSALFLWVAVNWFVLRPVMSGRSRRKLDALIKQVERIKSQMEES